jgi:putative nucleotidyltransferase with HDIG domain
VAQLTHLIRRFFGFLTARPLGPREQAEVAALLSPAEAELFWSQHPADQRHAIDVARRALRSRPGARTLARAGLLHDIGKSEVELGAIGRSLATVGDAAGIRLRGRFGRYRRHGELGAAVLESAGVEPLIVAFAREHPGPAPEGFDRADWAVLLDADHT